MSTLLVYCLKGPTTPKDHKLWKTIVTVIQLQTFLFLALRV